MDENNDRTPTDETRVVHISYSTYIRFSDFYDASPLHNIIYIVMNIIPNKIARTMSGVFRLYKYYIFL